MPHIMGLVEILEMISNNKHDLMETLPGKLK